MLYGLYMSAEGAQAQATRLEVLSNNLANADTVGFKRDLTRFQARFAEEIDQGLDFPGSGTINNLGGGIFVKQTQTDYSMGPLQQTGRNNDLAVRGDGFFMVRKQDGDFLSRAGNFNLLPNGGLVTQEGYPVMDNTGNPVVIDPEGGPWSINPMGDVIQQGAAVGQIGLFMPQSLSDLVKIGENLFRPQQAPTAMPPEQRQILSGYLEKSGVKPTLEMTELIATSRVYEANINMIRNQDQMLGNLISRILKV